MRSTTKLIALNCLSHMTIPLMFYYGSPKDFLIGFVWWQWIAMTSISSGYHRYFSHGSFKTHWFYEWYVQILGLFANAGPVLTWASVHRMHHAYSETEKDPHSPLRKGFFKVFSNFWGFDVKIERRFLRDFMKNKSVLFFHRNYFKMVFLVMVICGLIDMRILLFGFFFPILCAFYGYGLINAYTHMSGEPKNSFLANVLTAGEGWHLNHHLYPRNWRIGLKWFEFDPGAHFISLIRRNNGRGLRE